MTVATGTKAGNLPPSVENDDVTTEHRINDDNDVDKTVQIDEIVVSANKSAVKRKDAPVVVSHQCPTAGAGKCFRFSEDIMLPVGSQSRKQLPELRFPTSEDKWSRRLLLPDTHQQPPRSQFLGRGIWIGTDTCGNGG